VVGEVARPGPYPLAGRTTLLELLPKAGGTANTGAEVVVVRPHPGLTVQGPVLPTDVAAGETAPDKPKAKVSRVAMGAIQAGDLDKNLALQPNDTVFVPPAAKVFVTRARHTEPRGLRPDAAGGGCAGARRPVRGDGRCPERVET